MADNESDDPTLGHDETLTQEAVSSRASGRPPEEESSEDPAHQAEVILEESDDRTVEGAEKSTGP